MLYYFQGQKTCVISANTLDRVFNYEIKIIKYLLVSTRSYVVVYFEI